MAAIVSLIWTTLRDDERGEISWKSLVLGVVVGVALMVLLAIFGVIKFLIPGE